MKYFDYQKCNVEYMLLSNAVEKILILVFLIKYNFFFGNIYNYNSIIKILLDVNIDNAKFVYYNPLREETSSNEVVITLEYVTGKQAELRLRRKVLFLRSLSFFSRKE